jgi:predicted  nucleic acid-binding Zn-ribbon protein
MSVGKAEGFFTDTEEDNDPTTRGMTGKVVSELDGAQETSFGSIEVDASVKNLETLITKMSEYGAQAQNMEASKNEYLAKSKEDLDGRLQDLEMKKNELGEIIAETKADEEKLREKAKNLEAMIEPRLLQSFKRIRKNCRNGLGIVYVQRDACGGCFAKIPPQRQLDVRMRKKVIVCEYCGRILIDPELAGVKADAPADEKPKRRSRRKKEEE